MDTERVVRVGAAVRIPFVVVNESSKGTSAQLQLFSADAVLTQLLKCPNDTDGAFRRRLLGLALASGLRLPRSETAGCG